MCTHVCNRKDMMPQPSEKEGAWLDLLSSAECLGSKPLIS